MKPKTIGIFAFKTFMSPWDPDSIKNGLPGAEEALLYMSQSLADLGYKVTVFAPPPSGSVHSLPTANPRYIENITPIDQTFDIAIAWRLPLFGKVLKKYAKKVYFWPHDANPFFHITEDDINAFDDVFWISEIFRKQFISLHPSFAQFTNVFGNGIVPEQFDPIKERQNPYSCIYATTWIRGLETLIDIWPDVKKNYPKATLDIYYGSAGVAEPLKQKISQKIKEFEGVTDHGMVGHLEINRAYEKASFWTYPCDYFETFCISALRAQLAGAVPVIIDGSALSETVRHGYKCQNKEEYLNTLLKALGDAEKISLEDRKKMGDFILKDFSWKKIALKWKETFERDFSHASYLNNSLEEKALKNAQILEKAILADPENSSYVFHLALDYLFVKDYTSALKWLVKRANMQGSLIEKTICLSQIKFIKQKFGIALDNCLVNFPENYPYIPSTKDLFDNINHLIKNRDFTLGYFLSEFAISTPKSHPAFEWLILQELAICANHLGRKEEAKNAISKILSIKDLPPSIRSQIETRYKNI